MKKRACDPHVAPHDTTRHDTYVLPSFCSFKCLHVETDPRVYYYYVYEEERKYDVL